MEKPYVLVVERDAESLLKTSMALKDLKCEVLVTNEVDTAKKLFLGDSVKVKLAEQLQKDKAKEQKGRVNEQKDKVVLYKQVKSLPMGVPSLVISGYSSLELAHELNNELTNSGVKSITVLPLELMDLERDEEYEGDNTFYASENTQLDEEDLKQIQKLCTCNLGLPNKSSEYKQSTTVRED